MTIARPAVPPPLRRPLLLSALLHAGLIALIAASPSFQRPVRKGFVQYVNFIGGGGGGTGGTGGLPAGGAGGGAETAKAEPLPTPKKPALRDLTVPSKLKTEPDTALRHPVDKPKRDKAPEKQAAITKPEPAASTTAPSGAAATGVATGGTGTGSGSGFGLRFGTGGGGGGTGGGTGGGGDPFGISGFPFQYYLQMISDKITANWFQSLVDPGVGGLLQTEVYFRIYRNGQISDVRITVPSGVASFDISARRAIENAQPFPPLPNEYDGQYLGITLIFEHAK